MIIKEFDNKPKAIKHNLRKVPKKYTIHNVQIIDASSSMFHETRIVDGVPMNKYMVARKALEDELTDLITEDKVNFTFTGVEFTDNLGKDRSPVKYLSTRAKPSLVKLDEPRRNGSMTPLWDAVGEVLTDLLAATESTDEKALIQIWTDGGENSSRTFTAYDVNELIKKCEDRQFTVTFGGTPSDVANVKAALTNLDAGNFVEYSSVADEMNQNFGSSRAARTRYTAMAATGNFQTKGFFKEVVKANK